MDTTQATPNETASGAQEPTPFETLQFRVSEAIWRWKVWNQLYMADGKRSDGVPEKFDLMNDVAPQFFAMLQSLLFEDVVLRICKLMDPEDGGPSKARRLNLSLKAARVAATSLSATRASEANSRLAALEKLRPAFKQWRDRRIAHEDHATAVGTESLSTIPFADVDNALTTVVELMKLLDPRAGEFEFCYADMVAVGDGDSLIYALRCSGRYHKECIARGQRPLA